MHDYWASTRLYGATRLAIAALILACGKSPDVQDIASCTESVVDLNRPDAGEFGFFACRLADYYDANSVPIVIGVRNRTAFQQAVRATFDSWGLVLIELTGPSGAKLEPITQWEPGEIWPDVYHLTQSLLPRGGVTGRIVDLACDQPEYAGEQPHECYPLFDFSIPGTYEVAIKYEGLRWCAPPCASQRPSENEEIPVEFPTIRLRFQVGG